MIVLLLISVVLGGIVAGLTGLGFLFWVVAIFVFICGLPGVLIGGFIQGRIDYAQDRADHREMMREIHEDLREDEREMRRQIRHEEYLDHIDRIESKRSRAIYNIDARSVHYHNQGEKRPRDSKGRFISKK